MSYFKHSTTKTTVNVLEICAPIVMISKAALNKMQLFIEGCPEEIGWLGTAVRDGRIITIQDMYLFKQEVHSATTEITPDGLAEFGEEILQQEDGMDIWNNLKVWGHSHVRMSVSPSGQDDKQMETFASNGHDWFIRIIGNKNGDMKLDVYDYATGVIYKDVAWGEAYSDEEMAIAKRIQELQTLLERNEAIRIAELKSSITSEIEEKVKKKSYTTVVNPGYWTNRDKGTTASTTTTTITTDTTNTKKKETSTRNADDDEVYTTYVYSTLDILESDKDIFSYFTQMDLLDVAECASIREVEDLFGALGYDDYFSYNDMLSIREFARHLAIKIYSMEDRRN